MEAKAVMTAAMSRRSREHRSSKNVINATGTIQESSSSLVASQLDIRRSSRLTRSSLSNPGAVSLSKGLDARANVAKALMSAGNSSVIVAESVEALRADVVVDEAGHTVVSGTVRQPHAVDANHVSPLPGPDAAGQGRPLRGRPRGRHVAPVKKIAKRAKRLQEVPLSESDGARILGRRIKVFWRDENKWFYGIVKAYNRGRKSHKIVYDDKEEEWLKLHEEKFKLQVLDGEVFGAHEPVLSRPSEDPSIRSSFGASSRLSKLKHANAASSANGGILSQNGFVREGEDDYPAFRSGRDYLQQSPEAGVVNVGGAADEFEGATPMVCESVDLEDPYAIDHTSISDSLVMFMRSKQSLAESRKVLATTSSSVPPSPQPATVAANPIEVSSSVEPSSSSGKVEISNVVITSSSSKAPPRPVVCDFASSEGCTRDEERGMSGGISCEDGKGSLVFKLVENNTQKGGEDLDLDSLSDPEDPYAIDQTSISDSLVMFMRSKQSLVESAKVVAIPSPQPAVEVFPSVMDCLEISEVSALVSSEARIVFSGSSFSEGCTFEQRGAPERISCEDGKGSSALPKTGDVDSTTEPNASDVLDSSEDGGLHFNGQQHVDECGVIEDLDSSPLDVVEEDVRPETPDHAQDAYDIDSGLESSISIETSPFSIAEPEYSMIMTPEIEDYHPEPLVRTERFISWYIARNLVKIDCAIPGIPNFSSWILCVDSEWKCVPYLTLFVLERDFSQECGPRDHISRDSSSFLLGTSRLVLQGSRTDPSLLLTGGFVEANPPCSELPCSISEQQPCQAVVSEQPVESIVTEQPVESIATEQPVESIVTEQPVESTATEQPVESIATEQPVESIVTEQPVESRETEQPVESMVTEQPGVVISLPDPEVLDSGVDELDLVGDLDVDDVDLPPSFEDDASAAPHENHAEDDFVGDTVLAVGSGSAVGLTEVQIGSAVEGEDEGGLACYRSWKSVKRGFSQVTPEDLGSDGLGAGDRLQGLLESELGCMALTKRQKVQVESLSSKDFDYDGEKDLSPQERGDKKSRSADTGECDSAVPRVNVLKLRKCSTGKGGWRVAGNSCMADRSGDGGEPLTPSSTADRKRSFSECFEFNQPESPEENGHQDVDGHESGCNTEKAKVKGLWSNCEVSSINDVTFNPRKRFKNGSTSSGTSEDSYATHYRTEETYPSSNLTDHVYPDSVCRGCIANVLVVQHDRGWREFGATIELQSCHGQGWMLIISVRGENTYAFKAEHAIVTGTTNRHTHAVVWKGGKGWSLEFDDKKQWQIFKELHEECYRRNAKTSSVRQIPIPGVRHIEDIAPRSPNGHFARPYSRYISTGEDEVEMALGNSRVVYDMDSEDEQWLVQINHERASARGTRTRPLIAEETLERLMDKLEKDAYLYQQEHKTPELDPNDVDSESCMGLATPEVIKVIYSYWLEKRKRKGMPLVRHFQPPAWEQYQKLLRLWEQEIARLQQEQPSASMQQLTEAVRKPPYFAFCLRPRGLEAQHKLSKQKSHRKQSWPGTAPRPWGGIGSLDALGRRQYYTEPGNGLPPGPRRPGRPRLSDGMGANLTGAFNMMREPGGAMTFRTGSLNEYAQRRAGKNKKSGRKARKQHLLAAQESRRKRSMMLGELQEEQPTDLALLAARKRSTAEALRARAQALYAVADAAMHKAVAAVIAADAQHAAEQSKELEQEEQDDDSPLVVGAAASAGEQGPTFGSWRRGVAMSKASASHRPGLEQSQSYGEDALLPVASWSQELGAGLGTRLLNKEAEVVEGIMAPLLVGRMRGEGMVAMPTR